MIIDKDDLRALRAADSISFIQTEEGPVIKCYKSTGFGDSIRILSVADQRVFSERAPMTDERARTIGEGEHTDKSSIKYVQSIKYDRTWPTVAASLRAGDDLQLLFEKDYYSYDSLLSAGFHADVLFLDVRRGKKVFTHYIGVDVARDGFNRMVKS